jgi:hypothetical protein
MSNAFKNFFRQLTNESYVFFEKLQPKENHRELICKTIKWTNKSNYKLNYFLPTTILEICI